MRESLRGRGGGEVKEAEERVNEGDERKGGG
jgi:hypothetical protein